MRQRNRLLTDKPENKSGNYTVFDMVWLFAFIAIILFYLILSYKANIDLTAGRFVLFMDERITFDGVRNILHPSGILDWIVSVVHGGDHRYGRSLWNSLAVFAFVPEYLWGESGQIISSRMAQVVILLSGYFILTMSLLRNWFLRFILMTVLLSIPFTAYYMSMPKPEPLQIFFIAVFLFFYKKNNLSLNASYWVYLGLAFGTKFSTLPLIPVFLFFAYNGDFNRKSVAVYFENALIALFWFLLGLSLAVPILAGHILCSIILYVFVLKVTPKLRKRFNFSYNYSLIMLISGLNVLLAVALYQLGVKSGLTTWVGSTLLNTAHGSDRPEVWFGSWVHYLITDWLVAPPVLSVVLIWLLLIYFLFTLVYDTRQHSWGMSVEKKFSAAVVMAGLALNLAIMFAAHRLWGMYLFPGTVLMVAGLFMLLHQTFDEYRGNPQGLRDNPLAYLAYIVLPLIFFTVSFWWMPSSISEYRELASRTDSEEYRSQYQSYVKITRFLNSHSKAGEERLMVLADPNLFLPESNSEYQIKEFWGPFTQWSERPDVIIFSARHTEKRIAVPENVPEYTSFLIERDGYKEYVVDHGEVCRDTLCYRKSAKLPDGGVILTLVTK